MKVFITKSAQHDLRSITRHIAKDNVDAAQKMRLYIKVKVESLKEHPYKYPAGRVANTREMVIHPRYFVVYAVKKETVWVLRILHTSQQYP